MRRVSRRSVRFRAKWTPVRVKKTRQNKNLEHRFCFNQNRCSSATTNACLSLMTVAALVRPARVLPAGFHGICCCARLPRRASAAHGLRCNRCDRPTPTPRPHRPRSQLSPSSLAIPPRGSQGPCAQFRAACSHRDRIWRDRRTPTTWCRPSGRSRKGRSQAKAALIQRQRAAISGVGSERTSGFRKGIRLRLPKAATGVRIEALPRRARSLMEGARFRRGIPFRLTLKTR